MNNKQDLFSELFNNLSDEEITDTLEALDNFFSHSVDKKSKNNKNQFGINSFLKTLDDEDSESNEDMQEDNSTYTPISERSTEDIVRSYLEKRGCIDIETAEDIDFIATDPADVMLGGEVPCKVIVYFIETESEEESSNFTLTEEQINQFRKVLLCYMGNYHPEVTDARVDLVLVSRDNKYTKHGAVAITHEMGIARLLLLSKGE